MKDRLLRSALAAGLEGLEGGGYARVYRDEQRREYPSSLHRFVAVMLRALGLEFRNDVPIFEGATTLAEFALEDGGAAEQMLLIGKSVTQQEREKAARSGRKLILLDESSLRSDILDLGVRVTVVRSSSSSQETGAGRSGEPGEGAGSAIVDIIGDGGDEDRADSRLQTIFLDDPSFNFDYAHILPKTEKCSVMHGHTSSALVEIVGTTNEGMVIDFNEAKPIIKEAIRDLDHKLFISRRYMVDDGDAPGDRVRLKFETVHGPFEMSVPRETTVLLEDEATVENLARELLRRISPRMPWNVEAIGVYVYEGLNKGTHLLARIHSKEAQRRAMQGGKTTVAETTTAAAATTTTTTRAGGRGVGGGRQRRRVEEEKEGTEHRVQRGRHSDRLLIGRTRRRRRLPSAIGQDRKVRSGP